MRGEMYLQRVMWCQEVVLLLWISVRLEQSKSTNELLHDSFKLLLPKAINMKGGWVINLFLFHFFHFAKIFTCKRMCQICKI